MKLALSVRIVEEFASKEKASLPLPALCELAVSAGYQALCMRGSQIGIHSSPAQIRSAAEVIRSHQLEVTMVTGDFAVVYNNDKAPDCLRKIDPYLELASALGAPLVRVALKTRQDIPLARHAAEKAAAHGIKLVHQCHVESLFETVNGIVQTLREIDHPNFGLVYEPANLELCGQDYGPETIHRLAPWICNVYLQNQELKPDGRICLNTWCNGPRVFDLLPVGAERGIDFKAVFQGLKSIHYRGPITVHQSGIPGLPAVENASRTSVYLKKIAAECGLP